MKTKTRSISECIKKRHEEILHNIKIINKRTINTSRTHVPLQKIKEINHYYNQPHLKLKKHLIEDLFVGCEGDDQGNDVILQLDIDGLLEDDKPPRGYVAMRVIHELKGIFSQIVSNDFLVTTRETMLGFDYFVYDWRSGRLLFNMISMDRSLWFIAMYTNGYCVGVDIDKRVHLINMMEKKKNKFVQHSIPHSKTLNDICNDGFEVIGSSSDRYRIVMIFSGRPHVFKWNLKEGKLEEEFVIENITSLYSGCMIEADVAVFQSFSPDFTYIYNLHTRQLIKKIEITFGYFSPMNVTHVGLGCILSIRNGAYINCYNEEKLILKNSDSVNIGNAFSIALESGDIFEYKDKLLVFGNRYLTTFSRVADVFQQETNSIPQFLNKLALDKFADITFLFHN